MSREIINPYSSPASDVAPEPIRPESWKAIAWRWEKLRVFYNLAVGVSGIPALVVGVMTNHSIFFMAGGTLCYAVGANVCYLLGPIGEMYLNWLVDIGERRFVPEFAVRLIRGRYVTAAIWLGGTLGSMALTLLIAGAAAFSVAIKNQP